MELTLKLLKDRFAVSKIDVNAPFPQWVLEDDWYSITKTDEELSVVCSEAIVPENIISEGSWRCLKVQGELDFGLIGILASISSVLAKAEISIFVVSTYNTDYVLVKDDKIEEAIKVLRGSGYKVI